VHTHAPKGTYKNTFQSLLIANQITEGALDMMGDTAVDAGKVSCYFLVGLMAALSPIPLCFICISV